MFWILNKAIQSIDKTYRKRDVLLIERLIMFLSRAFAINLSMKIPPILYPLCMYTLNICTHNLAHHTHQGVKINSTFVHAWKLFIQYPRNRVHILFMCVYENWLIARYRVALDFASICDPIYHRENAFNIQNSTNRFIQIYWIAA